MNAGLWNAADAVAAAWVIGCDKAACKHGLPQRQAVARKTVVLGS